MDGVTSAIQTQINEKAPSDEPRFTGNVGIGTSSPEAQLELSKSNGTTIFITNSSGSFADQDQSLEFRTYYATTGFIHQKGPNLRIGTMGTSANDGISFYTGGGGGGVSGNTGYTNTDGIPLIDSTYNASIDIPKMKIIQNGNVGIGTTSPDKELTIFTTTQYGGINVQDSTSNCGVIARIDEGTGYLDIWGEGNNERIWFNGKANQPSWINTGGNVGIGTTSPDKELTIFTTTQYGGINVQDSTSNCGVIARIDEGTGYLDIWGEGNNERIWFNGKANQPSWINTGGNVGIGTDGPAEKLHVIGNIRLTGAIWNKKRDIRNLSLNSDGGDLAWEGETYHQGNKTKHWLFVDGDGDDEHAYFNEGNVGIGTNDPGNKLSVNTNTNYDGITLYNSSSHHKMATLRKNDDDSGYFNLYSSGSNVLSFVAKSNENSYINNGGNLGIGTNSPSEKLHIVNGNVKIGNTNQDNNSNNGSISFHTYSPTGSSNNSDSGITYSAMIKFEAHGDDNDCYIARTTSDLYIWNGNDGGDDIILKTKSGDVRVEDRLVVTSSCSATSFTATSDARHKENICDLENSLEKICSIRGVNFNFKDDKNQKHAGVLAQEVDSIIPEAINKKDNEKWSANYNTFVGYLIESVKTLKKENDDQNVKIENLESKLEAQGQLIQKLMEKINIT